MKVTVTRRALMQRINRELKKQNAQLFKNRKGVSSLTAKTKLRIYEQDMGQYFIVRNGEINGKDADVDMEILARKLEVLADFEKMED